MELKITKCPNCGAPLKISENKINVRCLYCGSEIMINDENQVLEEANQVSKVNINNLLDLGEAANKVGNYEEASNYLDRILEVDPQNYFAWSRKGDILGVMSTFQEPKINGMIIAYKKAIKYAPKEKKEKILEDTVLMIHMAAFGYYTKIEYYLEKYVSLRGTWEDYLDRCLKIIELMEFAHECDPYNTDIIEEIIRICKGNIECKIVYEDENSSKYKKKITPDYYKKKLKEKMNLFTNKMKQIDRL